MKRTRAKKVAAATGASRTERSTRGDPAESDSLRGRHVIFYRLSKQGLVEVIRILHEHMLPELHL